MYILEIDAGNSAVKMRLRTSDKVLRNQRLSYLDFFASLQALLGEFELISTVDVVSVAGIAFENKLDVVISKMPGLSLRKASVQPFASGVSCAYDDPSQLGIDRWMAILAADKAFDGSKVVVDLGSALTLDFVDNHHQHLGGYIVPGWNLMRLALENGTQINHDRIPKKFDVDNILPGKNTFDAIGMGRLKILCSMIESSYRAFARSQPKSTNLIFTGGDAALLMPHLVMDSGIINYIEDLVLDGLSVLFSGRC